MFLCLFWVFRHTRELFLHHHCRWRATNFDLCSTLMAVEQWRFNYVPHQLWHRVSLYNGHLRRPVTLTPVAERLTVELSLPLFRLRSVAAGIRTPTLTHARHFLYTIMLDCILIPRTLRTEFICLVKCFLVASIHLYQ